MATMDRTATVPSAASSAVSPASPTGAGSVRFVNRAVRWVHDGRRLDMQGLADEMGVSRATLFRRVGGREALLGKVLWALTERTLVVAAQRWEAERPEGALHTPGTGRHVNAIVSESIGLRHLLDDEPALTLRLLTDPRGQVQTGIVTFVAALIRSDMAEFELTPVDRTGRARVRARATGGVVPLRGRLGGAETRRRDGQSVAGGTGRRHLRRPLGLTVLVKTDLETSPTADGGWRSPCCAGSRTRRRPAASAMMADTSRIRSRPAVNAPRTRSARPRPGRSAGSG